MKIYKRLVINNKIFSKTKVLDLLRDIYDEYDADKSKNKRLKITLHSEDGTKYEYDPNDGLVDKLVNDLLKIKRIVKVLAQYYNFDDNKDISVKLVEGTSWYVGDNSIDITGNDPIWAEGKIKYYSDFIDRVKNRNKYIDPLISLVQSVVFILTGFLMLYLLVSLSQFVGYKPSGDSELSLLQLLFVKLPFLNYPFLIAICYMGGFLVSVFWDRLDLKWLKELFPSLEFDFGRVELSSQKKLTIALKKTGELIILPVVLWILTLFLQRFIT